MTTPDTEPDPTTQDTTSVVPAPPASDADPSTSPVIPAPAPPGDFGSSSFWTSPSSYVTIATYLLPVLTGLFHKDFSQYAQAIAQLAPIVATAVLLIQRGLHKREVLRANAQLASHRLQLAHEAALNAPPVDDARVTALEDVVKEQVLPLLTKLAATKPAPRKRTARAA